jgi:hypothetical protein
MFEQHYDCLVIFFDDKLQECKDTYLTDIDFILKTSKTSNLTACVDRSIFSILDNLTSNILCNNRN